MRFRSNGFTLVELMVTIAVLAILLAIAAPSFSDTAERRALQGAADSVVAVIGAAKSEAAKRNALVKVDFKAVGTGFCVGAGVVATPSAAGCDCSSTTCPLGSFPSNGNELRNVKLTEAAKFGSVTSFVIDPRTGMLSDESTAGSVKLEVPRGYGLEIKVNAMGRARQCAPSGKKALPGMEAC